MLLEDPLVAGVAYQPAPFRSDVLVAVEGGPLISRSAAGTTTRSIRYQIAGGRIVGGQGDLGVMAPVLGDDARVGEDFGQPSDDGRPPHQLARAVLVGCGAGLRQQLPQLLEAA